VLMVWQGQEPRPFYIRWQNKMSYINQALKKAQKDKDAGRIGYIRSIGRTGGSAERSSAARYIYLALAFLIVAAGVIYYIIKDNGVKSPEIAAMPAERGRTPEIKKESREVAVPEKIKEEVTVPVENEVITDKSEGLYKKAVLLLKEKRVKEALAIYMEILDKDPGHFASLNDIGVLYLQEGKYTSAIINLEKAVRLNPRFVTPCYNLACAYALNKEPEKGMVYLEKAVSINKEVKAWAKDDPDLNNLRGQSGFIALIE
jgi:tetratricopeptide (TPR) repeat protein